MSKLSKTARASVKAGGEVKPKEEKTYTPAMRIQQIRDLRAGHLAVGTELIDVLLAEYDRVLAENAAMMDDINRTTEANLALQDALREWFAPLKDGEKIGPNDTIVLVPLRSNPGAEYGSAERIASLQVSSQGVPDAV